MIVEPLVLNLYLITSSSDPRRRDAADRLEGDPAFQPIIADQKLTEIEAEKQNASCVWQELLSFGFRDNDALKFADLYIYNVFTYPVITYVVSKEIIICVRDSATR